MGGPGSRRHRPAGSGRGGEALGDDRRLALGDEGTETVGGSRMSLDAWKCRSASCRLIGQQAVEDLVERVAGGETVLEAGTAGVAVAFPWPAAAGTDAI